MNIGSCFNQGTDNFSFGVVGSHNQRSASLSDKKEQIYTDGLILSYQLKHGSTDSIAKDNIYKKENEYESNRKVKTKYANFF